MSEVQILLVHLPDWLDPKLERDLVGILSPVEQDRFGRIKSHTRKLQFLFGHLLLATVTSDHTSLSHSGDVVAVAGFQQLVGVDVEKIEAREYQDQIAERIFSAEEFQEYRELKGKERLKRFYELWTLNEARLKAGAKPGEKGWQTFCAEPKEGYAMTVVAKQVGATFMAPEIKWVTVEEIKQVGAPLAAPKDVGAPFTAPEKHRRRSIRLKDCDYSKAGGYFVTICTKNRECLFGNVVSGEMQLNGAGKIVQTTWRELTRHFVNVELDSFVIMPNHFHGVIMIHDVGAPLAAPQDVGAPLAAPQEKGRASPAPTLGDIVRAFKSISAIGLNRLLRRQGPIWQRDYYEHIVRDADELDRIREYIADNPLKWDLDRENPDVGAPLAASQDVGAPLAASQDVGAPLAAPQDVGAPLAAPKEKGRASPAPTDRWRV